MDYTDTKQEKKKEESKRMINTTSGWRKEITKQKAKKIIVKNQSSKNESKINQTTEKWNETKKTVKGQNKHTE